MAQEKSVKLSERELIAKLAEIDETILSKRIQLKIHDSLSNKADICHAQLCSWSMVLTEGLVKMQILLASQGLDLLEQPMQSIVDHNIKQLGIVEMEIRLRNQINRTDFLVKSF